MKSARARISAIIVAAAALLGSGGAAMVGWGAPPAPHHAVVADTWTKHAKVTSNTWG